MSVIATGKLLWEVKGGGHGQAISKAEVTQAADAILQPLMDLLDCKFYTQHLDFFLISFYFNIFSLWTKNIP